MPEPMRDALSTLQDHLPSVDLDAVRDRVPSLKDIDAATITQRIPKPHAKRKVVAIVGGIAAAAAVFGFTRRRYSGK